MLCLFQTFTAKRDVTPCNNDTLGGLCSNFRSTLLNGLDPLSLRMGLSCFYSFALGAWSILPAAVAPPLGTEVYMPQSTCIYNQALPNKIVNQPN